MKLLEKLAIAIEEAGFHTKSSPDCIAVYRDTSEEESFAIIDIQKSQVVIATPIQNGQFSKNRADISAKVVAWVGKTSALLNFTDD